MNGYKLFYKDKQAEVYAKTSYEAQLKGKEIFKTKKGYDITVMLCEKEGEQVIHNPTEL